jgi:hypothetical protein
VWLGGERRVYARSSFGPVRSPSWAYHRTISNAPTITRRGLVEVYEGTNLNLLNYLNSSSTLCWAIIVPEMYASSDASIGRSHLIQAREPYIYEVPRHLVITYLHLRAESYLLTDGWALRCLQDYTRALDGAVRDLRTRSELARLYALGRRDEGSSAEDFARLAASVFAGLLVLPR